MKKFISVVLTFCMLATMVGTFSVSAAANDGRLDFDTETEPAFTVTGEGTANEMNVYNEDSYKISGRVSHPAHSWHIEKDVFGKKGYSILGKGTKDVAIGEKQTDPCLIGFVDLTNPAYLTSTDQYYNFEYDVEYAGNNSAEILATTDDGSTIVLFNLGTAVNKGLRSDALLHNNDVMYTMYPNSWHKIKVVIKSADVTAKDGEANDATAENAHQYWIYANGNLIKSGTAGIKKRNSSAMLNSFAGIKSLQFRSYGIADSEKTTGDWSMRLDNIKAYVTDSLPVADWEASIDFDSLTDSTDLAAINNEIYSEQIGYLLSGAAGNYTWLRSTTKGCGSVEGGVYGKDASDKAISVSLDGNQTDGTHFFQITQAGQGMNTMQRMGKGDFYEFQTYMAWEPDAKIIGVQGFYSNTASNDGKGYMLLNVSPATGALQVLGTNIPKLVLSNQTWYKFNIVVHSGDVNAENDADKNWFSLYINDTLVAEKVVFTPSIRNGKQDTFLGVDQYWFQVGAGAPNKSGKAYYDDIKIKYSTSETTYTPVTVSTTDEIAQGYLGAEGHVPGFGSYVDERVSFDADKWSVTDGTISFASQTIGADNHAKIVKADGTKIYDNFKITNNIVDTKKFSQDSNVGNLFSYAPKDFSTYTFTNGVAGRSADDYSFRIDSVGVYDNWVMTVDEQGNKTSAEYQKDPANWINKSDIPTDTTAKYAFRDSYNPFVQMYKDTNIKSLDFNAPWSMNISILAGGEFNTKDIQAISDDNGGRVTTNLVTLNGSNGLIYVNKQSTGVIYAKDQWMNFVLNVYPATKGFALWYDGELIYEGTVNFPWERMARIKLQDAIGHDGYHSDKARTSRLYADDIMFIQGSRFVPVAVNAASESDKFDTSYLENDVIIANQATTAEDILAGITGGTVSLYSDKTFVPVTTGAVNKGNFAVIKSADGLIYKYIYVANADQDAKAEMAYTQSYQLGANSFAPKYYTDNIIDGTIIAASYKTVNDNYTVENCDYEAIEDAKYEYNGINLIMTPSKRVELTATEDTAAIKIFLWDDISGLKPIAAEHDCRFKVAEAE